MIEKGSAVKMNYKLTVDGNVVDQSKGEPLAFTAGQGMMIPGVDKAIIGMKAGDKKSITVTPEEGYGVRKPEAMQKVPKEAFKGAGELQVGAMVSGSSPQGQFQAVVAEMDETTVTLDLNHPLAGKTLNFDLEIVEVGGPAAAS